MNKKFKNLMENKSFVFSFLSLVFCSIPLLSFAQSIWPSGYWGPLVSCVGVPAAGGTITKMCTSACDLLSTFSLIVAFGESIVVFIVTPIFFAWGGIMILASGGNPGKLQTGKKIFTGTLIGILITLGAYLIVTQFIQIIGVQQGLIQGFGTPFNCSAAGNNNNNGSGSGYSNGTSCVYDWECQSNFCDPATNKCASSGSGSGSGSGYSNGTSCAHYWECQSNFCDPATNKCASSGSGSGGYPDGSRCVYDFECQSSYCDQALSTCQPNDSGSSVICPDGTICQFGQACFVGALNTSTGQLAYSCGGGTNSGGACTWPKDCPNGETCPFGGGRCQPPCGNNNPNGPCSGVGQACRLDSTFSYSCQSPCSASAPNGYCSSVRDTCVSGTCAPPCGNANPNGYCAGSNQQCQSTSGVYGCVVPCSMSNINGWCPAPQTCNGGTCM